MQVRWNKNRSILDLDESCYAVFYKKNGDETGKSISGPEQGMKNIVCQL
jgi:hypothetical protein